MLKRGIVFVVALLAALPAYSQTGEWKKPLKQSLESVYTPTVLARSGVRRDRSGAIEDRGTILVVQKAGILAASSGVLKKSTVRDGTLTREFQEADADEYLMKVGDRVYIEKIDVDDDAIAFRLRTAEPIERVRRGTTIADRYAVQVKFEFDRAVLPSSDLASLKKTIGAFLKLEAEATAPKTIALGQTFAEVEAILGKPATIIDLGAKKTYLYPNMRIIFTDGRISDVQ